MNARRANVALICLPRLPRHTYHDCGCIERITQLNASSNVSTGSLTRKAQIEHNGSPFVRDARRSGFPNRGVHRAAPIAIVEPYATTMSHALRVDWPIRLRPRHCGARQLLHRAGDAELSSRVSFPVRFPPVTSDLLTCRSAKCPVAMPIRGPEQPRLRRRSSRHRTSMHRTAGPLLSPLRCSVGVAVVIGRGATSRYGYSSRKIASFVSRLN
jgi:hypothetical protein